MATATADSAPGTTHQGEDLRVSLVTFGPGDAVHQYFGHNALLVEDFSQRKAALYNFGMFSFGPDMLTKYLQGRLEFWVATTPVVSTFEQYKVANRSIRVRELNLSPRRRRVLAEKLAWHVQPEHRNYLYHHYENNCSTKVRDLIDSVVDGALRVAGSQPARMGYRDQTRRYTQHDPFIHMLLLLWMNDSMERPIQLYDETFLPDELERLVDGARYVNEEGDEVALVKARHTLFEARRVPVPDTPSIAWPGLLAFGSAFGALAIVLAVWMRRRASRVARVLLGVLHMMLGVFVGLPGLIAFLLLFTEWDVSHYNENLWLANPLVLLAVPLGLGTAWGSPRALRWMGYVWAVMAGCAVLMLLSKLLPQTDQDTRLPMALLMPMYLACAAAHRTLHRRGYRRLNRSD